jgi:thiol-disulfide isomerase/thioredoxin
VIAGLAACLAALAVATGIGLAWRATNGKMRQPRAAAAQTAAQPATGRQDAAGPEPETTGARRLSEAELGQPLGQRVTLLQFSSAFCAPCRATRRILAEVADMTEGVAHVEIDAESHLDLVRELGILRTPTVLVLGADGAVVRRASGQPRKADVIGAIGTAIGEPSPDGLPANSYSTGLETG